jgi:hypothetical protein
MKHAYFLQSAFDNVIGPIVWTGAYNQALQEGMTDVDAVRFADGVIRQTQNTTLPEDVSRIETGPAYARLFTQFIGYFNMLANTNASEIQKISREVGIKKGAGKVAGIVFFGLLAPAWIAEAYRGYAQFYDDALALHRANPARVHLVRFEELKASATVLAGVAAFIGVRPKLSPEFVFEWTQFERMTRPGQRTFYRTGDSVTWKADTQWRDWLRAAAPGDFSRFGYPEST